MKTLITIEDGKITVQVDDQAPAVVHTTHPITHELTKPQGADNPAPPPRGSCAQITC